MKIRNEQKRNANMALDWALYSMEYASGGAFDGRAFCVTLLTILTA